MLSITSPLPQPRPFPKDYRTPATRTTTTSSEMTSVSDEQAVHTRNPYNETPTTEPFNIDYDLVKVLNKNQAIIERSLPRFVVAATNPAELDRSLIHIIALTRLDRLGRFPESEKLYFNEFSQIIKLKYSSSCLYLKQRLNFHQSSLTGKTNGNQEPSFFCTNGSLKDRLDYRVIRNEWPYAIPRDYQHIVVWSRLPLLDPSQARTSTELSNARNIGLSGFENLSPELVEHLDKAGLNPHNHFKSFSAENNSPPLNPANHENQLDTQIRRFVSSRWPRSLGFIDLMWFLNPIHLQSCPQLPHFHVFVKKIQESSSS